LKTLTFTLLAVIAGLQAAAGDKFLIVDTPDYRGVIFPPESAAQDKFLGKRYEGFWTPTLEQITKAETRIAMFLYDSTDKQASRERKKLKWFRRQYVGYTSHGEQRILCNFLPGREGEETLTELEKAFLYSRDKGPDYWEIHYRLKNDDCILFHVDLGY
jgi:hypothetical protein